MEIEKQLEFDKIKEKWMELAVTENAKEQIRTATFFLSESELKRQLRDTTNGRDLMEKFGTPPLQNVSEIQDILVIAQKGDCLTPDQLERVEVIIAAISRLKDYLSRGRMYDNPIAFYEENLVVPQDLREEICSQIRGGQVCDGASRELMQIRSKIIKCEDDMKQKAEQVMRAHKDCMADQFCTYRNGRICVPVKKEHKLKISGTVIDKSSTGNTLFMEPTAAFKYYEELQLLKIAEENEIYQILYTLTAMVAMQAEALSQDIAMIEKLDFIFSKGKLSMDLNAVEPAINTNRVIALKDARHPLMNPTQNVPLQFEIGKEYRGIIITGPNTGGKTVAIKTVMLNCMMAQYGLHVTCKEADICMNSTFLCDIGDGQNIAENLSTFSAHIKNVLEVLKEVDQDSLVIMDELGSGTDPVEGMGIAIAILEELRKSGALFLATTHYPEVKEYADRTDAIINARMTFDKETLKPTYQMVLKEAGESCAFYIADRLGMPRQMLKTAIEAAYGVDAVSDYEFHNDEALEKTHAGKIVKSRNTSTSSKLSEKFKRGDSVMVYPDKKIGIVCKPVNEKGVLQVQMPGKKIWINHKRVKLHVAATELYPEDYDFSIIFDTVQNRKIRHDMQRKYTEKVIISDEMI